MHPRFASVLCLLALSTAGCGTTEAPAGCALPSVSSICSGTRIVITLDDTPDTGSTISAFDGATFLGEARLSGTIEIARAPGCIGRTCELAICSWNVVPIPTDVFSSITLEGGASSHDTGGESAGFPVGSLRLRALDAMGETLFCNDRAFSITEVDPGVWRIAPSLSSEDMQSITLVMLGTST